MAANKRKTNVQIVKGIMEHSQYGVLAQAFVIDALTKVSEKIASLTVEELTEKFGDSAMVSPAAWHGVATEIKRKLDEGYGPCSPR